MRRPAWLVLSGVPLAGCPGPQEQTSPTADNRDTRVNQKGSSSRTEGNGQKEPTESLLDPSVAGKWRCVAPGFLLGVCLLVSSGCSNQRGGLPEASREKGSSAPEELLEFVEVEAVGPAGARYRLEDWADFEFEDIPKKTAYQTLVEGERPVLRARSQGGASALRRKVRIDPAKRDSITWTWKVERCLEQADCSDKARDDCAARVMLLYAYDPERVGVLERAQFESARSIRGEYPPVAVLVYAWTESARSEEWLPNPSSDRIKVFPVRRGAEGAGTWLTETRNHLEDFRKAFGAEPTSIEGVALMVDTDDTGGEATAWFCSLKFGSSGTARGW